MASELCRKGEFNVKRIELLAFIAELGITTSADVAHTFEIPLNEAAAYLTRSHGKGLLRRWRDGRRFEHVLSVTGARKMAYWRALAHVEPGSLDSPRSTRPRPPQVLLWCAECKRALQVGRGQVGLVVCGCGRNFEEADERPEADSQGRTSRDRHASRARSEP